jgi:two-component system CheB/CheR fusion protein
LGDQHRRRIFALLRAARGVDFSHYKEPTVRRRLFRRMLLQKTPHVDQYVKLLEEGPGEVQSILRVGDDHEIRLWSFHDRVI